ncbi:YheC/YheD family protein [Paenibacillus sp. JX-17]|uniref:YheC/YheD family protein n=1 Tax=Paenibacillus lacisoli TaxID=3064525 RepID=A0ABT9CBU2_9BACL|nr:YheC/YheD family protein [Paenibacillus sp. JX-17]MDO7906129.1 YheC/YheD family protein [Paenibacillus sp. JX-17]
MVAILTTTDASGEFRGNRRNFKAILKKGKELGHVAYVAAIQDLESATRTVKGYVYQEDLKDWVRKTLPQPEVIYNRIPTRKEELKVRKQIEELLARPELHLYNPYFFNKWELFEWLKKSKSTVQFIPATRRLKSPASLGSLLKQHNYLYLKPESGKAGKGIMILKYVPGHSHPYHLTLQKGRRRLTRRTATLRDCWKAIRRKAGTSPYIVQQGIELAALDERPFDLRVLVQKNGKGSWSVTGVGARLAGPKSITTHVPRGGSVEDPEELLSAMFGIEHASVLLSRVKTTALIIARQIERGAEHVLGEMSMDLGVDQNGGIWFFEANSRPMKFDEPHIRKRSLERIFHYASHLVQGK